MINPYTAGSKVNSVTHINSYTPDASTPATVAPVALLEQLGEEAEEKPDTGFVKNPKIVKDEAVAMRRELEHLRDTLDGPRRVAQAEELKAVANRHFSAGKWRAALVGYLAGIWLVRRSSDCPLLVALAMSQISTRGEDFKAALAQVANALGAAVPGVAAAEGEAEAEEAATAVRVSLHLNMAAVALKISEWAIAKSACEYVLSVDISHVKALFRLAKVHEGEGELQPPAPVPQQSQAQSTLPL